MKQFSVLYLCPLGWQHQEWRLAAAPAELTVTMRRHPSRQEIISLIPAVDVLISERSGDIDREIITAGQKLKLIQRIGSLYHDIDLAAAHERGIPVALHPIRGVIAVAEHMVMQILATLRRVVPLQQVVRLPPESFRRRAPLQTGVTPAPNPVGGSIGAEATEPFTSRRTSEDIFAFNWSGQTRVGLLYHKTVGILGFGEIGAELARRIGSWGCRVLYSKRTALPSTIEQQLKIEYRRQEDLLQQSDIVVCLLPYFPETDLWLNAERIRMMKPGAILCEAGSGSVVDEQAVADAIQSGHLAGAAFDTYEWEPLKPDNPLLRLVDRDPNANILLTPHIGACAAEFGRKDLAASEYHEFYENAMHVMNGQSVQMRVI